MSTVFAEIFSLSNETLVIRYKLPVGWIVW